MAGPLPPTRLQECFPAVRAGALPPIGSGKSFSGLLSRSIAAQKSPFRPSVIILGRCFIALRLNDLLKFYKANGKKQHIVILKSVSKLSDIETLVSGIVEEYSINYGKTAEFSSLVFGLMED